MDRRAVLIFVITLATLAWFGRGRSRREPTAPPVVARVTSAPAPVVVNRPAPRAPVRPTVPAAPSALPMIPSKPTPAQKPRANSPPPRPVLPFVIEDGVAVTMGDVVMGVPREPAVGYAALADLDPWRGAEVAYFVRPELPNPERVSRALALFADTPVRFVEYTTQDDVLVFEPGVGACKSYLGRIGGKQPIWLSPGCGPVEIAHEIMHALGFIHEQNRADRDQFVRVLTENIEPGNDINFARLPEAYMRFSGRAPFDYTSVMMYPKTMFGVGGRETIESLRPGVDVGPGRALSDGDVKRLRAAFKN